MGMEKDGKEKGGGSGEGSLNVRQVSASILVARERRRQVNI